jgi:hypothetical protein
MSIKLYILSKNVHPTWTFHCVVKIENKERLSFGNNSNVEKLCLGKGISDAENKVSGYRGLAKHTEVKKEVFCEKYFQNVENGQPVRLAGG